MNWMNDQNYHSHKKKCTLGAVLGMVRKWWIYWSMLQSARVQVAVTTIASGRPFRTHRAFLPHAKHFLFWMKNILPHAEHFLYYFESNLCRWWSNFMMGVKIQMISSHKFKVSTSVNYELILILDEQHAWTKIKSTTD